MKCYHTTEDLARDIRRIVRSLPEHVRQVINSNEPFEVAAATISLRGGAGSSAPVPKAGSKAKNVKAIKELNTKISDLTTSKRNMDNIIASLLHGFNGHASQVGNLDGMRSNAIKSSKAIAKEIEALKKDLHVYSEGNAGADLKEIVDKTYTFITKSLKGHYKKASKSYMSDSTGSIISGYIVLTDVSDDTGDHISSQDVFAVTEQGGDYYFNPSLNTIEVPGSFNKGIKLTGSGTTGLITSVKRLFQSQRAADGQLSSVAKVPAPMETVELADKIDGITKSYVKDGSVYVNFNQTVGRDPKLLQSAINDVQAHLAHIAFTDKARVRIVYAPPKNIAKGSQVVFSFIPANKYSGVTVEGDETSYLRGKFPESEVKEINKLLRIIRSNPDNLAQKDLTNADDKNKAGWLVKGSSVGIYVKDFDKTTKDQFKIKLTSLIRKVSNIYDAEISALKLDLNKKKKRGFESITSLKLAAKISSTGNEATIYLRSDVPVANSASKTGTVVAIPKDTQDKMIIQIKKIIG